MVKDVLTGELKPADTLYRVVTFNSHGTKVTKYYTSEEAYKNYSRNEEFRKKFVDEMAAVLGYKPGMVFPTSLSRCLKDLKAFGYEAVYETFKLKEREITWAIQNKTFTNEYNRVAYLMAIIKNNVADEYRKLQLQKKLIEDNNKRDVAITDVSLDNKRTINKGNVSSLLGDEEWI